MGEIMKFPVRKNKIYGYEITVSGRRPSGIREFIGFLLFELAAGLMGFNFMVEPIEKIMKDHNSFRIGEENVRT